MMSVSSPMVQLQIHTERDHSPVPLRTYIVQIHECRIYTDHCTLVQGNSWLEAQMYRILLLLFNNSQQLGLILLVTAVHFYNT